MVLLSTVKIRDVAVPNKTDQRYITLKAEPGKFLWAKK